MPPTPPPTHRTLVGRAPELDVLHAALDHAGPMLVDVSGEPGIGKSALLGRLAELAGERGRLVLTGRATEYEREVPLGVFVDALDPYLHTLDPALLQRLGPGERVRLAAVFPALRQHRPATGAAGPRERYHFHRAVRSLLARLAARDDLVLVLEDMHWADEASNELLAALLRRPLDAPVLIAVSARPHHVPASLHATLEQARISGAARRLVLGPLPIEDARAMLPTTLPGFVVQALHRESGGNPFYLEQMARTTIAGRLPARVAPHAVGEVPTSVMESIADEIRPLPDAARILLDGAAIMSDPFDPADAAAAAGITLDPTLHALDALVDADLVRPTAVPRRFRFRHPLVRRAVYESTDPGWRLAAHRRAAQQLLTLGAGAAARARHVECSATPGDVAAIDVLAEAAADAAARAPATAAHWLEAAMRLVPADGPGSERRLELFAQFAVALVAMGRFADGRAVLLELIDALPPDHPARPYIVAGCASTERLLGRHAEGSARLLAALGERPDPTAPATVLLRLELAAHVAAGPAFDDLLDAATETLAGAARLGDAPTLAAATGLLAIAEYGVGRAVDADARRAETARLVAALPDGDLGTRLEIALFLGWADLLAGRSELASETFGRGLAVARATGQSTVLIDLMVGVTVALGVSGRVSESVELAEAAVEEAEMLDNDHTLAWALYAQCAALETSTDLGAAVGAGERAAAIARRIEGTRLSSRCGAALAAALLAAGAPDRAAQVMLELQGGPALPWCTPSGRAACCELLTRAELAAGRPGEARRWAQAARAAAAGQPPYAAAYADRAEAAVRLADGDADGAARLALAAATTFGAHGARIASAESRLLAGRAYVALDDRDRAAVELRAAEGELMACEAERLRQDAVRELRRIGRRVSRRGRDGRRDVGGSASLTVREREVAELAATGETNRVIAGLLFLSEKTVESHMASVFVKLAVSSRGSLAGALAAG